jgi:hypothetical protein
MSILIRLGSQSQAIPFEPSEIEPASHTDFMPSSSQKDGTAAALQLLVYYVRAREREALDALRTRFVSLGLWIVRHGLSEIGFMVAKAQLQLAGSHLVITITEEGDDTSASFELVTLPASSTMH